MIKPINLFLNIPETAWHIWDYSAGVDFYSEGKGFRLFVGADVGFTFYNKADSVSISTDGRGKLKLVKTKNIDNGDEYSIISYTVNAYNIVGTVLVAIYAPYLLPAIIPAVAH